MSRPSAATRRPAPLRADLARLRRRRLILWTSLTAGLLLVVGLTANFFLHSQDLAGARAKAERVAQAQSTADSAYRNECIAAAQDESARERCTEFAAVGQVSANDFFRDPRFFAPEGIPAIIKATAYASALFAMIIGATAIGADWSSRTVITLVTWQPRRLRFLGTRFTAIAVYIGLWSVLLQGIALAGAVAAVHWRGTWSAQPGAEGIAGREVNWREIFWLEGRAIILVMLIAVLCAAITCIFKHSAAVLGIAFGWFVLAEPAISGIFQEKNFQPWLLTSNIRAWLDTGGFQIYRMMEVSPGFGESTKPEVLSNGQGIAVLGGLMAFWIALAMVQLRRRDL